MARNSNPMGGKVARGSCEGCKLDLGNTLDPYCWSCAAQLERSVNQRRLERMQDRIEKALYRALEGVR